MFNNLRVCLERNLTKYLLSILLILSFPFTGWFEPSVVLSFIQKNTLLPQQTGQGLDLIDSLTIDPMTARSLSRYGPIVRKYSDRYEMDWRLVLAVIRQESSFRHDAVSHRGAYGLMQIMPTTQAELTDKIGVEEAISPWNNIRAGVFHLRSLYRYFDESSGNDRTQLTLAAYNAGLGRIRDAQTVAEYLGHDPNSWSAVRDALPLLSKRYHTLHRQMWLEGKPRSGFFKNFRQTTTYVENVMQYYQEFKLALG